MIPIEGQITVVKVCYLTYIEDGVKTPSPSDSGGTVLWNTKGTVRGHTRSMLENEIFEVLLGLIEDLTEQGLHSQAEILVQHTSDPSTGIPKFSLNIEEPFYSRDGTLMTRKFELLSIKAQNLT
jgi:hypothetical protein